MLTVELDMDLFFKLYFFYSFLCKKRKEFVLFFLGGDEVYFVTFWLIDWNTSKRISFVDDVDLLIAFISFDYCFFRGGFF